MDLQPLFRRFHDAIHLKQYGENAELREKRDRVLRRLHENLKISFEWFNQGSYEMGTGIKPIKEDYDIDIGIVFTIDHARYDPVEVKRWVYKAVEGHTKLVKWRRPCITVYYQHEREPIYHVDLAILAKDQTSGRMRLAIGKEYSALNEREWQEDDRQGFMKAVEQRLTGEDGFQLRRVIRYLKRWKDVHFSSEGHAAPTGLALTAAAHRWFQPARTYDSGYSDLAATISLVQSIGQGFRPTWDPTLGTVQRLSLQFPNAPYDDVFAKMSNQQMKEFYERVEKLLGWLDHARRQQTPDMLRHAFGTDFPQQ